MRRLYFPWSHGQAVWHCPAHCRLRAELRQYVAGWNAGAPATAGGADSDESVTSYSTDVMWSCRREPPPDEVGDAEEPRATSVLQQDSPEVVDLGVTVSDVVELGDTRPEVVDLSAGAR